MISGVKLKTKYKCLLDFKKGLGQYSKAIFVHAKKVFLIICCTEHVLRQKHFMLSKKK